MLAAASATASTSVIGQAQAAEKGAAKPATGAVQPASPRRFDGPSPVSAPAPTVPGMSPAPVRPVVQEVPATNDVATSDVARGDLTRGDGATASPAAPAAAANASDLAALGRSPAEERESQIAAREAMIAAAEKRLSERLAELVVVQQRLQGLESGLKERDEANWLGLVKLYEGMKPREAAAIFNSLEKPVLIEILDRMKPVKASPILASMDTERARQVTADLAARRTIATTN
jgi:flagellar motility protein MotE (MotC chaperone)